MPSQWNTSFILLHQLIYNYAPVNTHYTSIIPHNCNSTHSACQSHIAGCKPSRASIDEVAFTRDLITLRARSTVSWSPINSSVDSSTQFTAVIVWLINQLLITQNTYLLLSCLAHICVRLLVSPTSPHKHSRFSEWHPGAPAPTIIP